jgi:hypothetical protein
MDKMFLEPVWNQSNCILMEPHSCGKSASTLPRLVIFWTHESGEQWLQELTNKRGCRSKEGRG